MLVLWLETDNVKVFDALRSTEDPHSCGFYANISAHYLCFVLLKLVALIFNPMSFPHSFLVHSLNLW